MIKKLKNTDDGYIYTTTNGREVPLAEMSFTHLSNAIAKMTKALPEKEDDDYESMFEEITILTQELESRPAPEEE